MSTIRFANGRVVTAAGTLDGATFTLAGGRIAAIDATAPAAEREIDLAGGWIVPGFIDVQVNGGGGVLFNDAPTVEGIDAIGRGHAPFGTTGFLPTLISDVPEAIARALDATEEAIAAGVPGCVGVHIEGPIINAARKGIHDPEKFRRLDDALIELLTRPRLGKVLLTLAPEMVSHEDIRRLAAAGVILSVGHSDADHDTVAAAFAAGMTGVTHLYNAMSPLKHREPGVVGAALDDQNVYCGIIADGFHVHDAALRIAMRAHPRDRFLLVTDAMSCVGANVDSFVLHGQTIRVENGCCLGADGTLAGSALDMAGAFRHVVNRVGVTPEEAAVMSATAPAAFLGLSHDRGALAPGLRADWVCLTHDLQPAGTWIAGAPIA
ncbi:MULTISPECIES: N-acetylglucosamine-6-phosphate deacetylase [Sphingomonas]|uniref:N-acetylglucosamine-6-phosphate deacetylase n=1 Tax=Sphingomonas TaxID=13687 RepID=UPI000F7DA2DB|nr:N-acetylglucosamine-6-phosphate deacetylase [Sphingomonas sp. ABOLF]RSV17187.1 N-acetylglucosamine-6-phosphate deacetylase [Sphingomonas sp. ABOLF]GLK21913.1 N-acetylglucosamine-6-phosphate deacetylase [Microbacterium terregens]